MVLSPHLDDAVFSLGAWMAGRSDVVVATVFAGLPIPAVDAIDPHFESGAAEVETRRREDGAACRSLGAGVAHGRFLDGPYNGHAQIDEDEIARWIGDLERTLAVTALVRPVGVRHPQHIAVARAAALSRSHRVKRYAYAELPYSVLWPDLVPEVVGDPVDATPPAPYPANALKQAACAMYVSQYPSTDQEALRAPERLWRLP